MASGEFEKDQLIHFFPEKRILIKIGSALLVQNGEVRQAWLDRLSDEIASLRKAGRQILVVSSGSIAVGRTLLGLLNDPLSLAEKQAAAACGQIKLAHAYYRALKRHDIDAGQVLITLGDTEERRRYLNACDTLHTLLRLGVVPVINENDTVATNEIRYGDNDRLSARIASMVEADLLILLSDVDGLYSADPRHDRKALHFDVIEEIDRGIEAMAGAPCSDYGSGGMKTKVMAAKIAVSAGIDMLIADGRAMNPLLDLAAGRKRMTRFRAQPQPPRARKAWITWHLNPLGEVRLDDGAIEALQRGKSLLPSGVIAISGSFHRGDCVRILDREGREYARGLIAYDADEAQKIQGHKSQDIDNILGYRRRDELIHRDHLALF